MLGDVGRDRALETCACVVPPERVARRVEAVVEAVACERGEIDPADERDAVVDDHELLVVAVHRPLLGVELHLDARAARQLVAHCTHLAAVRVEERQRRAGPGEHPDVAAFRRIREQLLQRRPAVAHGKVRREEPARDVDVRLRTGDLFGHPR